MTRRGSAPLRRRTRWRAEESGFGSCAAMRIRGANPPAAHDDRRVGPAHSGDRLWGRQRGSPQRGRCCRRIVGDDQGDASALRRIGHPRGRSWTAAVRLPHRSNGRVHGTCAHASEDSFARSTQTSLVGQGRDACSPSQQSEPPGVSGRCGAVRSTTCSLGSRFSVGPTCRAGSSRCRRNRHCGRGAISCGRPVLGGYRQYFQGKSSRMSGG